MVIDESDAIGTTFLRARLLPEPNRKEVTNLWRRYVDFLLELYGAGIDKRKIQEASNETERMQNELW